MKRAFESESFSSVYPHLMRASVDTWFVRSVSSWSWSISPRKESDLSLVPVLRKVYAKLPKRVIVTSMAESLKRGNQTSFKQLIASSNGLSLEEAEACLVSAPDATVLIYLSAVLQVVDETNSMIAVSTPDFMIATIRPVDGGANITLTTDYVSLDCDDNRVALYMIIAAQNRLAVEATLDACSDKWALEVSSAIAEGLSMQAFIDRIRDSGPLWVPAHDLRGWEDMLVRIPDLNAIPQDNRDIAVRNGGIIRKSVNAWWHACHANE